MCSCCVPGRRSERGERPPRSLRREQKSKEYHERSRQREQEKAPRKSVRATIPCKFYQEGRCSKVCVTMKRNCVCARARVCVFQIKESARRMASTTNDTSAISSKCNTKKNTTTAQDSPLPSLGIIARVVANKIRLGRRGRTGRCESHT